LDLQVRAKKIRRHRQGELMVEQARDPTVIAGMLAAAGIHADARAPACALIAYVGDEAAGIAGVETAVDIALTTILFVHTGMRRRGIGAELMRAARVAAHTRGARNLYKIGPPEAGPYLSRFGFEPVEFNAAARELEGMADAERLCGGASGMRAWRLDISMDGVIQR
jgi:GNAT superfamily N-acetyltransferase